MYNAENYVGKCIESVQAQTYSHWQMILVDDGSKDKSLDICQKYAGADNRIHVIHQENAGPGIARNAGFNMPMANMWSSSILTTILRRIISNFFHSTMRM